MAPPNAPSNPFFDAAREHLTNAEDYARISVEATRLQGQTPGLSEKDAIQQSLKEIYGDKAPEIAKQIASNSDQMTAFRAGQEFHDAKDALKAAGMDHFDIMQKGKVDIGLTAISGNRNFFAHPEQNWRALPDGDLAKAANRSLGQVSQTIKTLQAKYDNPNSALNADQRKALGSAIDHLEHMREDLVEMKQGLTPATDINMAKLDGATQLQEVQAGRNAKAGLGRAPGALAPDQAKMMSKLSARGSDIAHLDPKPGNSTALERVRDGTPFTTEPAARAAPVPAAAAVPETPAKAPEKVESSALKRPTLSLKKQPEAAPQTAAGTNGKVQDGGSHSGVPSPATVTNIQDAQREVQERAQAALAAKADTEKPMVPQKVAQQQRQDMRGGDVRATQDAMRQQQAQAQAAANNTNSPSATGETPSPQSPPKAPAAPVAAHPPVTTTPVTPGELPSTPPVNAPVAPVVAAEEAGAGAAGKLPVGKIAGGALLALGPVVEASTGGYNAYKQGQDAPHVALATGQGAVNGAVDTVAPGLRTGYADVIGDKGKDITKLDRILNGASDVTQTATVASAGVTAAGVETGPLDIAPAAVAVVSGVANLGVNLVKAGLKVTNMAGKDQDGGYIYNGVALAGRLAGAGIDMVSDFINGSHPAAHDAATPTPPLTTPRGPQTNDNTKNR